MTEAEKLLALADTVEREEHPEQFNREFLIELFRAARPRSSFASGKACDAARNRFVMLWEIGAHLDAAMMLVPADQMRLLDLELSWEPCDPGVYPAVGVRWYPPFKAGPDWHALTASGRTPGLALTVACLRALARRQEQ